MKAKVIIETEEDLCGEEFLDNGEMSIEGVEGFDSMLRLSSNGFEVFCTLGELQKALTIFEK